MIYKASYYLLFYKGKMEKRKVFTYEEFMHKEASLKTGVEFELDDGQARDKAASSARDVFLIPGWLFMHVNGVNVFDFPEYQQKLDKIGFHNFPLFYINEMCRNFQNYLTEKEIPVSPLIAILEKPPEEIGLSADEYHEIVMRHVIAGQLETVFPLVGFRKQDNMVEVSWYPSHIYGEYDRPPKVEKVSVDDFTANFKHDMKAICLGLKSIFGDRTYVKLDELYKNIDDLTRSS